MSYYGSTCSSGTTTNFVLDKFSQQEHEVLRRAAEARKQGKILPEYDEKGQLTNPYIPLYIAKAPCTECSIGFLTIRVHQDW